MLNHPSTEQIAQDRIVGQTRLRISMGRLREMEIPTPPLCIQQIFSQRFHKVQRLKLQEIDSQKQLDHLFASLQHRAFRGEL